MNCIQTFCQTQSNGTLTAPVNGSWIQAYAEYLGLTEPVNESWLQAVCIEKGITQPLWGSWTIALANFYNVTTPNATWWCALADLPYTPLIPPFIWDQDTRLWEAEVRKWAALPPYDSDALAFFNAVEGGGDTLTLAEKAGTNTLVVDLKTANIWPLLKAFYPLVGGTITSQKWNLMDPQDTDAAFRITFAEPQSFTFNLKGWKQAGNPPQAALSYFNPSVELTNGDFSFGCSIYDQANPTGSYYDMGAFDGSIEVMMIAGGVNNSPTTYLNLGGGFATKSYTGNEPEAIWIGDQGGTKDFWRNGTIWNNYTSGTALVNLGMGLGCSNRSGLGLASNRGYTMFFFAKSLDALGLLTDFNDLVAAWQIALGKTP